MLIDFLPSILEDNNTFKNILTSSNNNSFLFEFIIQSTDILSKPNNNVLIFNLMDTYILEGHTDYYITNKLNKFPNESLKEFEKNLDFSIALLKDKYPKCNEQSLLNNFKKVLLNQEFTNKLQTSANTNKEKKQKI